MLNLRTKNIMRLAMIIAVLLVFTRTSESAIVEESTVKFVIDCTLPVDDKGFNVAKFEQYLDNNIKIGGETSALAANNVVISRDGPKLTIASPAELKLDKRQLKFLSKRYLKKKQLNNDFLVVAASKNSYEMRYKKE